VRARSKRIRGSPPPGLTTALEAVLVSVAMKASEWLTGGASRRSQRLQLRGHRNGTGRVAPQTMPDYYGNSNTLSEWPAVPPPGFVVRGAHVYCGRTRGGPGAGGIPGRQRAGPSPACGARASARHRRGDLSAGALGPFATDLADIAASLGIPPGEEIKWH